MADLAEGNARKRRIDRLLRPIRRFMEIEASSGLILIAATLLAVGLANSPLSVAYQDLLHAKVLLAVGGLSLSGDVAHLLINDGLMTIFFFVVGLEIKREMVQGELSDVRSALLPMFAALGGMVVPAVVYALLQWGQPGQNGWAIPMATDIAFAMSLFINTLSFTDSNTMLNAGKIGIFMGSILSALVGIIMLWVALRKASTRVPR